MSIADRSELNESAALQTLQRDDALLLTASSALAADWKRRLAEFAGEGVSPTAQVRSWAQWLAMLAAEAEDIPVPLGELQEQLLWEKLIRSDRRGEDSASARGLARHAARACVLMREYRIDDRELAGEGEEAEALVRWMAGMQKELASMERVLAADLPGLLLPELGRRVSERHILLDGFAAFTPMQQSLLQALQDGGIRLESLAGPDAATNLMLTRCSDAEAEYRHVAKSIASRLESAPQARIGILLSRQVKDMGSLRRILNQALLPEAVAMHDGLQAVQMAGEPLSAAPLVSQLMRLLQLAGKQGTPFAEFSPLLFSPGLKGYADERMARAGLDAALRENNRHYIGFKALLAMREMQAMPQLSALLKALLVWDAAPRPAGEWVRAVHTLLQHAGYLEAEAQGRSSADIRQLNTFRECLVSLLAADAVSARMDWPGFLSLLGTRCQATQLTLPAYHPGVCVLPLEQAPGLQFDVVFAVGLDEEALPLPARPAPLLPFSVQRRNALPGATATLAFEVSCFLWRQVLASAPEVHASFALSREDREMGPSPLLAGIHVQMDEVAAGSPVPPPTEVYDDAPAVPLSPGERIRGGSGIVKDQSACPFRAFAGYRLGLAPLGDTTPGIEPKAKGSLLHAALEYIWTRIRSQAELLALGEDEAAALVEAAVAHAWEEARVSVPAVTQTFERRRMLRVLGEWLGVERVRPPFTVEQCEKEYRLFLPEAGEVRFPVKLKADRIDRDAEGHKILIDYKTGAKHGVRRWLGERMAEPQLPLYAMAENLGENDAVCFAQVRNGEMEFEGLSGEPLRLKKITQYKGNDPEAETWPELIELWRHRINALAAEFVGGRGEVAPRDRKACEYCGLEAVCRIGEIGFAGEDADDSGESA